MIILFQFREKKGNAITDIFLWNIFEDIEFMKICAKHSMLYFMDVF